MFKLERARNSLVVLGACLLGGQGLQAGASTQLQEGAAVEIPVQVHAAMLAEQALAFEHGEGVARDAEQAAALYCESARLGNSDAMYALGWMYANGRGLPRADGYASALFALAAEQGHEHAQNMLKYTGAPGADRPSCLDEPAEQFADAVWNDRYGLKSMPAHKREIAELLIALAPEYQISPRLALAIALTESALNPVAVSPKNAQGVMQLIPDTAARFNVRDPFDPEQNIRGGLAYLRWLLAYFEGDVLLAAAGYNAGEGAVDRFHGVPPYRETQAYVVKVLDLVKQRHHPFDPAVVEPSIRMSAIKLAAEGTER